MNRTSLLSRISKGSGKMKCVQRWLGSERQALGIVMEVLIGYYFPQEEKTGVRCSGLCYSSRHFPFLCWEDPLFLLQPLSLPLWIVWVELTPFPTLDFAQLVRNSILFSCGNYLPDGHMTQWSLWEPSTARYLKGGKWFSATHYKRIKEMEKYRFLGQGSWLNG